MRLLINTSRSTITSPDADISGFPYFLACTLTQNQNSHECRNLLLLQTPRSQTDVDLNPRLPASVWCEHVVIDSGDGLWTVRGYSDLVAFPHRPSLLVRQVLAGFVEKRQPGNKQKHAQSHVPTSTSTYVFTHSL